jgi:hypothetical protein
MVDAEINRQENSIYIVMEVSRLFIMAFALSRFATRIHSSLNIVKTMVVLRLALIHRLILPSGWRVRP